MGKRLRHSEPSTDCSSAANVSRNEGAIIIGVLRCQGLCLGGAAFLIAVTKGTSGRRLCICVLLQVTNSHNPVTVAPEDAVGLVRGQTMDRGWDKMRRGRGGDLGGERCVCRGQEVGDTGGMGTTDISRGMASSTSRRVHGSTFSSPPPQEKHL